jgi:hypothetical protein
MRSMIGLLLLPACTSRTLSTDGGNTDAATNPCDAVTFVFPVSIVRDLDILFVIDNSPGMDWEQRRLDAQIDTLMQALSSLPGGFPDAHIGVVSTDLGAGPYTTSTGCFSDGDAGKLQDEPRVPACTPPGLSPYIDIANANNVISGNIANVDTPTADGLGCQGLTEPDGITPTPAPGDTALDLCDIEAAFRCIARLGTSGCGFEQPLESARRALTCSETSCTNPGFIRDTALLLVVFLGDDDDCSARDGSLFDPNQSTELGPLTSYRCFEFGVTCDEPIDRSGAQTLHGCRSKTVDDVGGNLDSLYLHPIQQYYDFFSTLKPENQVLLAAIAGPYTPGDEVNTRLVSALEPLVALSCTEGTSGNKGAYPAIRTNELVRRFGLNGLVLADQPENAGQGICADDYRPALRRLGDSASDRFEPGCLSGELIHTTASGPAPIDDPAQADCTVTELSGGDVRNETGIPRPRCTFAGAAPTTCPDVPPELAQGSTYPCWYICDQGTADAGGCPYRWKLRICRDPSCDPWTPAAPNTDVFAECAACDPAACSAGCP